ncbi:MAG: acyl-CoA/acyl-ACP dehydrogenase, partial [Deltaproteobacteria bacterium]|nr:acyl-CoA/acyl-ACP dehydrogenase [Deltaproteobacteria bacterium]
MDYFSLIATEQDKMIAQVIRRFVDQEIMPIRDKIDDDTDHVLINEILSKLGALGIFQAGVQEDRGDDTPRPNFVTNCIVIEEMSRGDVGIGMVAVISGWAMMPAVAAGNREIIELFQAMSKEKSPCLACFAMTEPASGCDVENLPELHGRTIATRAVQDGDQWVINGAKRFPSSAGVSSLYCVVCQTETEKGEEGIALIYVPVDAKGLSFGKFEIKAGLQADRNADIFFDDVRVPLSYRASGPGRDAELLKSNLTNGRVGTAAAAIGVAKGTFEEVLKYTGERVVAGKPIREHSIAAGMLAEMATGIETAQAHCLQVAYMLSHQDQFGPSHSEEMLCQASITKNYATEMAIMVTNKAMELMGSYG